VFLNCLILLCKSYKAAVLGANGADDNNNRSKNQGSAHHAPKERQIGSATGSNNHSGISQFADDERVDKVGGEDGGFVIGSNGKKTAMKEVCS
jgi:hypothetical protein